jgi:gamma-secretase subunit APH-1
MLDLFFGCLFVAFGPAAVFLFEVVIHHSHLTVLTIVAAFFELVGFLLTSVVWFIMPASFRGRTATALVCGVFIQELFRVLFIVTYGRGEKGLAKTSGMSVLPFTDFPNALSAGFGFGLMYALLVYGNVLGKSVGEADFYASSCPHTSIFLVEAYCALAMQILHVALMIVAFDAWRRKPQATSRGPKLAIVWTLHLLASLSTLINQDSSLGGCSTGVPLLWLVVALSIFYVIRTVRQVDYKSSPALRREEGRDSVNQSAGGIDS